MLPGMSGIIGGTVGFDTPFVSSASAQTLFATTLTINKPTSTTTGDLLIAIMSATNGSSSTWTGDTGWTEAIDQAAVPSLRVAYKVAGGSEGASYTFTGSNSSTKLGIIMCYRGVSWDAIGASVSTITGDGALSITGITSNAGAGVGILLAAVASGDAVVSTHSVPSGMTLLTSKRESVNNRLLSIFAQNVAAGATGTRSSTIGGGTSDDNGGILMALKP